MFFENLKLAINSLVTSKMRTFLSLLGIVIGVASVVTIMNLGESVKKSISDTMNIGGVDLITVTPLNSNDVFNEEFGYSFLDNVTGIESVSSSTSTSAIIRYMQESYSCQVYGVTSEYFKQNKLELLYGEQFTKEDNIEHAQLIILGYDLAQDLFPDGSALGSYISLYRNQAKKYKVIGVLEDTSGNMLSNTNSSAYIPFNTFSSKLRKIDVVSQYTLLVNEDFSSLDVVDSVKEYLSSCSSSNDYLVTTAQQLVDMTSTVTGYLTSFLSAIASISLIVGGIGIMNIMLVTVVERTREIGIRKALGATPKDIRRQFLVEATVLSILGGIIGIVFGDVVSYIVAKAFSWPLYISPLAVVLSLGFSSAVGIFFGWYPAAKASSLDPIEALSYE